MRQVVAAVLLLRGNCIYSDIGDADGCSSIGVEEVLGELPRPPESGLTDNSERLGGEVHPHFHGSVKLAIGEVGLQNAMEAVGCGVQHDAAWGA